MNYASYRKQITTFPFCNTSNTSLMVALLLVLLSALVLAPHASPNKNKNPHLQPISAMLFCFVATKLPLSY